ncbi:MAG: rhodanese-like domain-containing protein [Verrucomicrobiota bacterium]|nr:rhodanese-like domain-containing protein [Verrucomicrobiota bacterium]
MKRVAFVLGLLVVVGFGSVYAARWQIVNAAIRREFRNVPRISTAELANWLNDTSRAAPLLLDTRTRAEYEVSHLPGAVYAGMDADYILPDEPRDRPIVTYCSVGYRSAKFARQLQSIGYTNVRNLEGSIFKWANEERPVLRDGNLVTEVHPYNSTWGLLLAKKYRARVGSHD